MTHKQLADDADLSFIASGLSEILGRQMLSYHAVHEGFVPRFATVKQSMLANAGEAETAGLCIRAGRASFHYWMKQNDARLGWKEAHFRLLPLRARTNRVMTDLLDWLEKHIHLTAKINQTESTWQISVDGLTHSDSPLDCKMFFGLLQEAVCWAGCGKFHVVREIKCQLEGADFCVLEIERQAAG